MIREFLALSFLFIVLLILLFMNSSSKKRNKIQELEKREPEREEESRPCPLCEKALQRGERVHSVIYSQGEDRLMNIYGCPWCYDKHPAGSRPPLRKRKCPSCGGPLKEGNFAIARVFERPGRKMHIHVLGCPSCRERSTK